MVRGTQAQPAEGQQSPPPTVGGRYDIGPLLGAGGTASVYRAHDRVLGRDVAVKLFHPGVLGSDERRLNREMHALGKLRHPGVVEAYAVGVEGSQAFLAMQLVDGHTLADRLAYGPLPLAVTIALGSRVADTLAHVHEHGVTHRDLKPGNVLLGPHGALISDFGVAKLVDDTLFTNTGVIVGTACYMAPEQVSGDAVGPPADIYALGLVLLECVTGYREYGGGPLESAVARLHRRPQVPEYLPPGLAALLRRMTRSEPADRPAAGEVSLTLRSLSLQDSLSPAAFVETPEPEQPAGEPDVHAPTPEPSTSRALLRAPRRRERRPRAAMIAAGAAASVLAAAGLAAAFPATVEDASDHTVVSPPSAPPMPPPVQLSIPEAVPPVPVPPTTTVTPVVKENPPATKHRRPSATTTHSPTTTPPPPSQRSTRNGPTTVPEPQVAPESPVMPDGPEPSDSQPTGQTPSWTPSLPSEPGPSGQDSAVSRKLQDKLGNPDRKLQDKLSGLDRKLRDKGEGGAPNPG